MTNKQAQKSGANSTNIQASEINVVQGISYSEARQVAIDVFKSNFYELAGEAKAIASERAEAITEKFLEKLQDEYPEGFMKSGDPDFQYSLYNVQAIHARYGDDELGDLLVDLLIDRSRQDQRSILQIVLNESLTVAPKITKDQLSILTVIFLLRYISSPTINTHEKLGEFFDKFISPFIDTLSKKETSYQHLQFLGCGSLSELSSSRTNISTEYQGLFLRCFERQELINRDIFSSDDEKIFIPCINDNNKIQINALNMKALKANMIRLNIKCEDHEKIKVLFEDNKMNEEEFIHKCTEIRPYMERVFDIWTDSDMQRFTLTSVGISIAHANIKRLIGDFSSLSIWIN